MINKNIKWCNKCIFIMVLNNDTYKKIDLMKFNLEIRL